MSRINVTKTFLPPQEEYNAILKDAWDASWLTNRGALVLQLEQRVKDLYNVKNIILTANGTLPIQIAIKVVAKNSEIITTPFSYVATTASILWENCKPIFVDIDECFLTIDEAKIEAAITKNTKAILATHVFGNPCNLDKIKEIAQKHNLKVIYDAAHSFGVEYNNNSIFNYGDVSTCSFHSTKLFHTAEGGAMFCNDKEVYENLYYNHNFGHDGQLHFHGLGINAKMSELQAALGLAILPYMATIISERKKVVDYYLRELSNTELRFLKIRPNTKWNYSYFPVIFKNEALLLEVESKLNAKGVYPRRYFYPSLNNLPYLKEKCNMPVSDKIAQTILCLPLYVGLKASELEMIIKTIKNVV